MMSTGLLDIIKSAAMDAYENGQPCDLRYGKVTSTSPLTVRLSNQLILSSDILIVPQHLTDYVVEVSLDYETIGRRAMMIHNSLNTGDELILLRQSGGQFYVILDRV